MKVLFIGVYADSDLVDKLNDKSNVNGSLSIAAIKYTRLIEEGFKQNLKGNCN